MKKVLAWHWSNKEGTLGYGDGRKIVEGETLSVTGKPVKCEYGLHGSESILDAMGYAAGCHLWRVEIWGDIDAEDDKLCGKHRKAVVDYGDVMFLVLEFAKVCADRAQAHAKSAKYAAKYAEYAAKYAKSAEYAAEYAKSAKYAAKYAEYAAKYAAKYAEYAAESAKSAEYAKSAAKKEREFQEKWWEDKLAELKG